MFHYTAMKRYESAFKLIDPSISITSGSQRFTAYYDELFLQITPSKLLGHFETKSEKKRVSFNVFDK